ncbi:MAG TPA: GntR family transcriptional regulator [Solirubrobacteraceae bacterium]|jgi:GntR family transcriptional regulator, rspAB operon transcriptional repressor
MAELEPQDNGAPARQSAEYVHRRVRAAILESELPPGETMSQVALADELGVSRTPLREALRMLQGEGLIEAKPNRRVRVTPISVGDLEELYALRVCLEAQALRLSVPRMTSEHIALLEGSIAQMAHYAEQRDMRRWLVPHAEYHRQLTDLAGERFSALLSQLFDHAERYRRLHLGHGPSAWATADHREILDAVKDGDGARAAPLLAQHLSRTAFEVAEILQPGRDLATLRQVLEETGAEPPRRVEPRR